MKEKKYFPKNFQKYDKKKINKFPKFQKKKSKKSKNLSNPNFLTRAHSDVQSVWGHYIETFFAFSGFISIKSIKLASVDFPPQGEKNLGTKHGVNF